MILKATIKPSKHTASSKYDVIRKATNGGSSISSIDNRISYSGYSNDGNSSSNTITVLNLHKVRRKVIQKKGKDGKTKSKVLHHTHWIAYAYKFDIAVLKAVGVKKLSQNSRNFTINY